MKNKYIFWGCMIIALGLSSCNSDDVTELTTKEQETTNIDSDKVSLSLTTNMQQSFANEQGSSRTLPSQRKLKDGQSISVFLNVFQKDATTPVYVAYKKITAENGDSYNCGFDNINLVRGEEYKIVTWAHIVENNDSCYRIMPTAEQWTGVLTCIRQIIGHTMSFATINQGFDMGEAFTAQCDIRVADNGEVFTKDNGTETEGLPASFTLRRPLAVVQFNNVRLYDNETSYNYAVNGNFPTTSNTGDKWYNKGAEWLSPPVLKYTDEVYCEYNALTQRVLNEGATRPKSILDGQGFDSGDCLRDYIFCDDTQGGQISAVIEMNGSDYTLGNGKEMNITYPSANYLINAIGINNPVIAVSYDSDGAYLQSTITCSQQSLCLKKITE